MALYTTLWRALSSSDWRFFYMALMGFYNNMDDETYLKRMYKARTGSQLDLINPKTYNEKVQWLKLFDRNPQYTLMVDKYAAKKYVADILGEDVVIPTLGVWDTFDEIPFDTMPDQFVLKCTHDSGGLAICRDKSTFDKSAAKHKINKSLKRNYFYFGREWPYKNVPPRIIAEKYMTNSDSGSSELTDYKIYCFGGVAKLLMMATDRYSDRPTHFDYFDRDANWLDLTWSKPHSETEPKKPPMFNEMCQLAEKLAKGIPELRVDLYVIDRKIYFGELTFFDDSGFGCLEPKKYNRLLGDWIRLPEVIK